MSKANIYYLSNSIKANGREITAVMAVPKSESMIGRFAMIPSGVSMVTIEYTHKIELADQNAIDFMKAAYNGDNTLFIMIGL